MHTSFIGLCSAGGLLLVACHAPEERTLAADQTRAVDISGLAPFWHVADQLLRDETPPASDWDAIFATPGYALLAEHQGADRALLATLPVALMPSRAAERGVIAATADYRATLIEHLRSAVEDREEIDAFATELAGRDLTSDALELTARWLPEGAFDEVEPPRVSFVLLEPDARGYEFVVMDIAFARALRNDMTPMIAHEAHHVFRNAHEVVRPPADGCPERELLRWLGNLNAEGIADQIDKPALLARDDWGDDAVGRIMGALMGRWVEAYEQADTTLAIVDAQLAAYAAQPEEAAAQGERLGEVLILGGHPVGFHMANDIRRAHGRERLAALFADPFAFAIEYSAAAEELDGGAHVFSPEALLGLERLRTEFSLGGP